VTPQGPRRDVPSADHWNAIRQDFEAKIQERIDEGDTEAMLAMSNMYLARSMNKLALALDKLAKRP